MTSWWQAFSVYSGAWCFGMVLGSAQRQEPVTWANIALGAVVCAGSASVVTW